MAAPERNRIGLREIEAMPANSELWDSGVAGFGARRQRSDAVAYVVLYRTGDGRQRRFTIGRHGAPWNPTTARKEAVRILGEVAAGGDPATTKTEKRRAATVAELCADYWADVEAGRVLVRGGKPKKASTMASDKGRIDGHIVPLLGRLPVASVTRADVENAMHRIAAGETVKTAKTKLRGKSVIRGGQGVATRTVGLLGGIFAYAVERGLRPDNPAHGVRKYAESRRDRRLSDEEYAALGRALRQAEQDKVWPAAVAAARFLALTGWRSGEALALRFKDVDLKQQTAVLTDTKTGRSVRPLGKAATARLAAGDGDALVFVPSRGKTTMTGFGRFWDKIAAKGPLPSDIHPHVLRHSFVSVAADLGYSDSTIAALVGHASHSITARYTHRSDALLVAAADAVSAHIDSLLGAECQTLPTGR